MLIGIDEHGERVEAVKGFDRIVYCPVCNERLINKVNGRIKIPHFSHQQKSNCKHGQGESKEHMQAKLKIKEKIEKHNNCTISELEYKLPNGLIADYYAEIDSKRICFEIINTHFDYLKVSTYYSDNYYICPIWIDNFRANSENRVKNEQKMAHYMGYGVIYVYNYRENQFYKLHFDKIVRYNEWTLSERTLKSTKLILKRKIRNFKIKSFNTNQYNDTPFKWAGFYNKKWW